MEVIKRDGGFSDKVSFSLRLLNIDRDVCDLLKLDFTEIKMDNINYFERASKFVVSIKDIEISSKYPEIIGIIRKHQIDREKINFFISLTTQNDMAGFTVPKKISDLHFNIGGTIDFSVISYNEDESE